MDSSFVLNLQKFLKHEKINMTLIEKSDSKIWVESPDEDLTMMFALNEKAQAINYDIFLPKLDIHLNEETIRDIEKIESHLEREKLWSLKPYIEDSWVILDFIKIWAQEKGLTPIEMPLI